MRINDSCHPQRRSRDPFHIPFTANINTSLRLFSSAFRRITKEDLALFTFLSQLYPPRYKVRSLLSFPPPLLPPPSTSAANTINSRRAGGARLSYFLYLYTSLPGKIPCALNLFEHTTSYARELQRTNHKQRNVCHAVSPPRNYIYYIYIQIARIRFRSELYI